MSAPTCDGCSPDWHWRCTECEATALRAQNSLLASTLKEIHRSYDVSWKGYPYYRISDMLADREPEYHSKASKTPQHSATTEGGGE